MLPGVDAGFERLHTSSAPVYHRTGALSMRGDSSFPVLTSPLEPAAPYERI